MPAVNHRKLVLLLLSLLILGPLFGLGLVLGIMRAVRPPHEILREQVSSPDSQAVAYAYAAQARESTFLSVAIKGRWDWLRQSVLVVISSPQSDQAALNLKWQDSQHLQVICMHCKAVTLGRGVGRWHDVNLTLLTEQEDGGLQPVSLAGIQP